MTTPRKGISQDALEEGQLERDAERSMGATPRQGERFDEMDERDAVEREQEGRLGPA